MPESDYPVTPGIRMLRERGVAFEPHLYPYEAHGGTRHAAACLQVDEHCVIKTVVMQSDQRWPLLVLMHGDREVSTRQLGRQIAARHVEPVDPAIVTRITGYQVGGVSPFGTRTTLPVYVEASILTLERIYINGGKRGFLVALDPRALAQVLTCQLVQVAVSPHR